MTTTALRAETRTKLLLASGPVGGWAFMALVLLQGAVRPAYSSLKYPLSALAIGENGWLQVVNFLAIGALMTAFGIGVRRALPPAQAGRIPRLFAGVGLGFLGAGVFVSDPVYGYPTSQPLALASFTWHGHLHDLFSLVVFVCFPLLYFAFRRRFKAAERPGSAAYSLGSGVAVLLAFVVAGIGFKQVPGLVDVAGACQRLCFFIGFSWLTVVANYLRSRC